MAKSATIRHAITILDEKLPHVLEFGVAAGKTMRIIQAAIGDRFGVYGFDSFIGLPSDWIDKNGKVAGNGRCVKGRFTTKGKIPNIPGVKFFKGWFKDTIKLYKQEAKPVALIHVDCDLYSSTCDILLGLNDYIVRGTILVFDEWTYNGDDENDDHEQKAFYEWARKYDRKYKFVEFEDNSQNGRNERKIVRVIK